MTDANNPFATPAADLHVQQDSGYADFKPFSGSGRMGRRRFFAYPILLAFAMIPIALIGIIPGAASFANMDPANPDWISVLVGIGPLALILVALYVAFIVLYVIWTCKRLHDINLTGWLVIPYFLIGFVPGILSGAGMIGPNSVLYWGPSILSFIAYILLLVIPGSKQANAYGAPPPPTHGFITFVTWFFIAIFILGFVIAGFSMASLLGGGSGGAGGL